MKEMFSKEVINGIKVGMNMVEGIGMGFCSNEKDVEMMKCWMEGVNFGIGTGYRKGIEDTKEKVRSLIESLEEDDQISNEEDE